MSNWDSLHSWLIFNIELRPVILDFYPGSEPQDIQIADVVLTWYPISTMSAICIFKTRPGPAVPQCLPHPPALAHLVCSAPSTTPIGTK